MDDDLRRSLFDPDGAHRLVLARRPADPSALTCVVSDVVWQEVVHLLRWSAATTGSAEVDAGRWWRLAAGCADLLRRLPALCDELGEPWGPTAPAGRRRSCPARPASRWPPAGWARCCCSPEPVTLRWLAGEVDALGAAAISALAQASSWAVPGTP